MIIFIQSHLICPPITFLSLLFFWLLLLLLFCLTRTQQYKIPCHFMSRTKDMKVVMLFLTIIFGNLLFFLFLFSVSTLLRYECEEKWFLAIKVEFFLFTYGNWYVGIKIATTK